MAENGEGKKLYKLLPWCSAREDCLEEKVINIPRGLFASEFFNELPASARLVYSKPSMGRRI